MDSFALSHAEQRLSLERDLANIAGEFPTECNRSGDQSAEAGNEYQDPMWLMAGLAERGWTLKKTGDSKKKDSSNERPIPTTLNADEEWLYQNWTAQALQVLETEQTRYFQHGSLGSKCDVADELDPVQRGIITLERAQQLFQVYWNSIHPQWSMLDPTLHTLLYVRSRSALLTTTISAVGATALASLNPRDEAQVAEAMRLQAHAERLILVVFAAGARSIDIIQAHILLCRWGPCPKTRLDEQRWMRAAMFQRMANEIGLHVPRRYDNNSGMTKAKIGQLRRNDLRTRVYLILNEYRQVCHLVLRVLGPTDKLRFFTFSGRQPSSLAQFELSADELEEITVGDADPLAESVVSLYDLCLFDRDVRRRLEQCQTGVQRTMSLDAELEHIRNYMERFIQQWCPDADSRQSNWHLLHDAYCSWLLLVVHVARVRFQSTPSSETKTQRPRDQLKRSQQDQQQLLLTLSTRMFEEALKVPSSLVITHRASIMPFAASLILRLSKRRDLVLRAALRMAGEPGRTTVKTFVKDAGRQMLVMLHTNKSRQPTPPIIQNEIEQSNPSSEDQPTSTVSAECQLQHKPNDERLRISGSDNIEVQAAAAPPPELPAPAAPFSQDFHPFMDPKLSTHSQTMLDPSFAFNLADFPYIPEPAQTQLSPQGSLCPPWTATELDAWIGTTASQPFPVECQTIGQDQLLDPACGPTAGMGLDPAYCAPFNGGDAYVDQQLHAQGNINSAWGLQNRSLADASNTTMATSSDALPAESRSTQREVLLAAVDRLVQLATLMQ